MNNICIWCSQYERVVETDATFKTYPVYQGGIFIHRSCNEEFMGTLIAMARREMEQGRF